MHALDDDELAQRAISNKLAFEVLYERHVNRVYRYLLVRTQDEQDAQDLTAQTFVAAWEQLTAYRPQGKFSAWLLRIARNKAVDHFRRMKTIVPIDMAEKLPHPSPLPEAIVTDRLTVEKACQLLGSLPPDRAEAITLRIFSDLTIGEIAATMGKK